MKKAKKVLLAVILSISMVIFAPNVLAEEVNPTSIKDIDIYWGGNSTGDFTRITLTLNETMDLRYSYIEFFDKTIQDMPRATLGSFRIVENEKPTTIEDYDAGTNLRFDEILEKGTKVYLYTNSQLFQAEEIEIKVYWKNQDNKHYEETIDYRVVDGGIQYVNSASSKDVTTQVIESERFYELLEKKYPFLGTFKDGDENSELYAKDNEFWIGYEIEEKIIKVVLISLDGSKAEDQIAKIDAAINQGSVEVKEDSPSLSRSALEAIRSNKIATTYEKKNVDKKLLYSWTFDGNKMTEEDTKLNINLEISLVETENKDKIDALIPSSMESLKIDFKHSGILPTGTSVKLNVADSFDNDDVLDLYYYNAETNALEKVAENILVVDGYASFPLAHCSEYVLVANKRNASDNNVQTSSMNVILYAIISVVSLLALGYILKSKNKEIA